MTLREVVLANKKLRDLHLDIEVQKTGKDKHICSC